MLFCSVGVGSSGCIAINPPIESYYNRGVDYYDQGKFADAIEAYKLALRANPDDYFAKYNLAVVYQDIGKTPEATDIYREILAKTKDANSHINLAAIHMVQGEEEKAFEELRKAAEDNPDSPNPPSILGEYLERKSRLDEAGKSYLKALQIDPKHAVSHFRIGRLYAARNKNEQSESHLKEAIDLNPETPEYLETLGNLYEKTGKTFDAIAMLERASVLQPDRAELFIRLGNLYKQKQFYERAAMRYWAALDIDERDPRAHRLLKELYEILGQQTKDKLQQLENQNTVAATPGK